MPRKVKSKATASKATAKVKSSKDDICIINCPFVKDHVEHALEHLRNISRSRKLTNDVRGQTDELLRLMKAVKVYMEQNGFHVNCADDLPERD